MSFRAFIKLEYYTDRPQIAAMVGPLVLLSLLIAVIATPFFLLGNSIFRDKGMFFATLSILVSFLMVTFFRFPWIALALGNGILYFALKFGWPKRK